MTGSVMENFGNIDGTISPTNRSAGIEPTAGVARGGQQGRMGLMHGGIGGARRGGGFQPGASPRKIGPQMQVPGLPPHVARMLKILSDNGGS